MPAALESNEMKTETGTGYFLPFLDGFFFGAFFFAAMMCSLTPSLSRSRWARFGAGAPASLRGRITRARSSPAALRT